MSGASPEECSKHGPRLSRRWKWGSRQPISFLMEQGVQNPGVISLAAGLVDQQSLPVSRLREAAATLLGSDLKGRPALQYGTTQGAERLRTHLLGHLAMLERETPERLGIDPARIVLTTGSQQLLSLVGEILVDPGDIVLTSSPTYFAYLGTLNGLGATTIRVAADDRGMRIDALDDALRRLEASGNLPRVKMIYAVTYYENPTGISLSLERRKELVDVARRWSKHQPLFVLEDAAYRELRYDGPELPSVWSFDEGHELVILAMTFSKSFAPGLRVGYGVVPRDLVSPICDRKGNEDFGSANLNQHLLATVMEQGLYEPHVASLRETYRAKRDAMLAAADRHFGNLTGVRWVRPHGGLYVWMALPETIDTGFESRLFRHAVEVERVMYVPGDVCYAGPPADRPRHEMRLSFGTQTAEGIDEGMRRLARAVRHVSG
jgi:2-aminoadipate transaminase